MESFTDITPYFERELLVSETAAQIIKDFEQFNLPVAFSGNVLTAYAELHSQLTLHLQGLLSKQAGVLMNLLYKIDVNEMQAQSVFGITQLSERADALSKLIIKRELQKVVIRNYYSKK
jgi:hypothetical protein